MEDTDPYRELNLNSPTFSSSADSQNTQEDCIRGLSLYHFLRCVLRRIKQNKVRNGWTFVIDFLSLVQWWHKHILEGWMGHSWRKEAERTAQLIFSLLSEFVYMWKTLHCFLTEEIVIQSFITFELTPSGIVLKSLLFLIQLIDGILTFFQL